MITKNDVVTIAYGKSSIIVYIFLILVAILLIKIVVRIIRMIICLLLKTIFVSKYDVKLPKGTNIGVRRKGKNFFVFGKIYWRVSNKDGTRDKRVSRNRLIREYSVLSIDEFVLKNKNPFALYELVKELRKFGLNRIDRNFTEKTKLNNKWEKLNSCSIKNGINDIINKYIQDPYQFETFCKDLYEERGYIAKQTSKSKDGGYDLLIKKDGKTYIVECKCYQANHVISRPQLQKLAGANQIVKADGMIFITTSSYSSDAVNFAKQTNIEIIDGEKLLSLVKKIDITLCEREVLLEDWELSKNDILKLYPKDIKDYVNSRSPNL